MCTLCITSGNGESLVNAWVTLLATVHGGDCGCGGGACGCNGRRYKLVAGSRSPLSTSVVPSKILHCVASNVMVYPASQNFAVARREA